MVSDFLSKRGFLSIISEEVFDKDGNVIATKIKYWLIKRYIRQKLSVGLGEDLNGVLVGIDDKSLVHAIRNGNYESLIIDDGDYTAPFIISALIKNGADVVYNSVDAKEINKIYSAFSENGKFLYGSYGLGNDRTMMLSNFDMLLNQGVEDIAKIVNKEIRPYIPTQAKTIWQNLEDRAEVMLTLGHVLQRKKDTKLTSSANAFAELVRFSGGKDKWREFNPLLSRDETYFTHQALYGGFNYLKPELRGKVLKRPVRVYDINSEFPSVMAYERLPVGEGKWFDGKPYHFDGIYIIRVVITGELKRNRLPFIRNTRIKAIGYVEKFTNMPITLSSVDLKLLFEQYYIKEIKFIGGFEYSSRIGVYLDFVKKLYAEKEAASESGNMLMREIAKHKVNSSFGRLGIKPERDSKGLRVDENGNLKYTQNDTDIVESNYMPAAVFIAAYARSRVIKTAQVNYSDFIYSDTDSMHLYLSDKKLTFKIDQQKLGYWKLEEIYEQARFIGNKTYMEINKDKRSVKAAGITIDKAISIYDFEPGKQIIGGKSRAIINGGAIHAEKRYTLR